DLPYSRTPCARLPARTRHGPVGVAHGFRSRRRRRFVRLRGPLAQARDRLREELLHVRERQRRQRRPTAARTLEHRRGSRLRRARDTAPGLSAGAISRAARTFACAPRARASGPADARAPATSRTASASYP